MSRCRLWIAIMALVLMPALHPASAQGQPVELELRLSRGEVVYYTSEASVNVSLEIGPLKQANEAVAQARQVTRVIDVDSAGVALIESVLEDLRVTSAGRVEEALDKPMLLRVGRDAKVVDRRTGDPEDFPVPLPGRPVSVGESWSRQLRFDEQGISGSGTLTFTLAAIDQTTAGRVARIRVRSEGSATGTAGTGPGTRGRGRLQGGGELEWSLDQGRLLSSVDDRTVEIQYEVTVQGQTVQGKMVMRVRENLAPLAASSVPVPAVTPEFLVSPGKGIGGVTFDLPFSDVSARLGASTARNMGNLYSAPSIEWRGGIVGFTDPSDQSKLIGLEVGDRRYRTEKGLGFGSSKGAVLLTHGMSPAQIEMQIPNLGGATALVYDDQGIAFVLTSDEAHASRGPTHAPVGAVDWIIVFPPGGAAKIFRTP